VKITTTTITAALLALAALDTTADDAGLQRCRAVKDSTQRLACYDALPLGVTPAPAASAPAATFGLPATAAPPAQAASPAAPAPSMMQSMLQKFGFESRPQPDELAFIESTIPGRFEGWSPRASFKLANGQVWQVTEETSRTAWKEDPKVKIVRGSLGSFFMEIEGINASPRVRRLQ
jgi:hypothetical protein